MTLADEKPEESPPPPAEAPEDEDDLPPLNLEYGFEILKQGQLCGKIMFTKAEMKLGRTPENDIECLHPSTVGSRMTVSSAEFKA